MSESSPISISLGSALRNDPQRDEGQQGEPGDAAQHDHSDEDQHGPEPRLTG